MGATVSDRCSSLYESKAFKMYHMIRTKTAGSEQALLEVRVCQRFWKPTHDLHRAKKAEFNRSLTSRESGDAVRSRFA